MFAVARLEDPVAVSVEISTGSVGLGLGVHEVSVVAKASRSLEKQRAMLRIDTCRIFSRVMCRFPFSACRDAAEADVVVGIRQDFLIAGHVLDFVHARRNSVRRKSGKDVLHHEQFSSVE
jgi:hypothetical protein